jgi:uracil-DNA glycosylase
VIFGIKQADFWNRVAFYNYLQEFAGTRAGHRPKAKQWEDETHFDAFQKVIDALKPDRILVLGKATWQNMPGAPKLGFRVPDPEPRLRVAEAFGRVSKGESISCWYHRSDGGRALAAPIYHPAHRKFDWKAWVPTVQELMRS